MAARDEDEVLRLFLVESREHLEGVENDLLAIESQGGNLERPLVNRVFRAVHTIKGAAGFFNFHKLRDLSHAMENVLDLIRGKYLVPNAEAINTLLEGADILQKMLALPEKSNDVDITDVMVRMKSALTGNTSPESRMDGQDQMTSIQDRRGREIFSLKSKDLTKILDEGIEPRQLYLVHYQLGKDIERKGRNVVEVINELMELTVFVDSKLDHSGVGTLEQVQDAPHDFSFYVLIATGMELDLICHFLELERERVIPVNGGRTPGLVDSGGAARKQVDEHRTEVDPLVEDDALLFGDVETESDLAESGNRVKGGVKHGLLEESIISGTEQGETSGTSSENDLAELLSGGRKDHQENSIRVNVNTLDRLMNLAGELVLTRNQLVRGSHRRDLETIDRAAQKVDIITSELQEAIMSTRMQSLGVVFKRFRRVVRDLGRDLGKQVRLTVEGEDVELDKTIIETIGDPLTHLVRNAVDHGVEPPPERVTAGKSTWGNLCLRAYHEAGQVVIEVVDDGRGIDLAKIKEKALTAGLHTRKELEAMGEKELRKLIFEPGLTTSKLVTEVSGRGVGMDVVLTNLNKLGGVIDINSRPGKGTVFKIKLPLTLAIIPSLLVSMQDDCFAIPQVNLLELVRIPAGETRRRIEKIGDASVMRLRGELLPIIRLRDALGIEEPLFRDPKTGRPRRDRRNNIADRRGNDEPEAYHEDESLVERGGRDRRLHFCSATNVAVLQSGDLRYGLIIDQFLDSSEIVVKPLGYHLQDCKTYAGATILGDGRVACILDVEGLRTEMGLSPVNRPVSEQADRPRKTVSDRQSLLLVHNGVGDVFAVPLELVLRIETTPSERIEMTGGWKTIQYRGFGLALFALDDVVRVTPKRPPGYCKIIVFKISGREMGLIVSEVVDIVEAAVEIDAVTHRRTGVFGSAIVNDKITLFLDLYGIVEAEAPEWLCGLDAFKSQAKEKVLIVDDSPFFLNQIKGFVEGVGYQAVCAVDGVEALAILAGEGDTIDLVLTDIEMPNIDGFELVSRIRREVRFQNLPVIAITSLKDVVAKRRGMEAGMDDYLIKLDREQILATMKTFLINGRRPLVEQNSPFIA